MPTPAPESMGSIFPVVAPLKVNVKNQGEWNSFRILMDWPRLQVWTNDEAVQDLDVETVPELRHRLRSGYLGLESLSYPIRFRNLRVRELPSKVAWSPLYETPPDFAKWHVSDGKPLFEPLGAVLHSDGLGHLATHEKFRDFELQMYVRHAWHHNGGVLFRTSGQGSRGRHYEIQLHDVEGAHYPTGSLYSIKRGLYPRIEAGQWWLLQMRVKDNTCLVRINGETVMEYDRLENLEEGPIELQAHDAGRWTEYKQILRPPHLRRDRSRHGKHSRNPRASRRCGVPGRRHDGAAGRPGASRSRSPPSLRATAVPRSWARRKSRPCAGRKRRMRQR